MLASRTKDCSNVVQLYTVDIMQSSNVWFPCVKFAGIVGLIVVAVMYVQFIVVAVSC